MIKIRLTLFFIFFGGTFPIIAQNLLINGSFEADSCAVHWYEGQVTGWYRISTADYYHESCVNTFDYKSAHEGRGCIGLYNGGYNVWPPPWDTVPSREYAVGKLREPLIEGQQYSVSYWVKPSSYFNRPWENMTTEEISLAFVQDTAEFNQYRHLPHDNVIEIPPDVINDHGILRNYEAYIQIEDCYTARGGEQWVILGSFLPLEEDDLEPLSAHTLYDYSYFMIDEVEVRALERLPIPEDTTSCASQPIQLDLHALEQHQCWLNGEQLQDSIILFEPGQYDIQIELGSCQTDQSFSVLEKECLDCTFFIPNVFSPNGDGINDEISIQSNCTFQILDAQIFNRWGALVYQSNNSFSWDGILDGRILNPGVYVYSVKVQVQTPLKQMIELIQGDVALMR